jgi:hypothetical protein
MNTTIQSIYAQLPVGATESVLVITSLTALASRWAIPFNSRHLHVSVFFLVQTWKSMEIDIRKASRGSMTDNIFGTLPFKCQSSSLRNVLLSLRAYLNYSIWLDTYAIQIWYEVKLKEQLPIRTCVYITNKWLTIDCTVLSQLSESADQKGKASPLCL